MFKSKRSGKAALAVAASVSAFAVLEARASRGSLSGEPDFLLVLGCRVRGAEAEETLKMRIESAARFLSVHKNTAAICCGGIVHDDQLISEAEVIKEGLLSAGIEESRIFLEDKSKTTKENFINAKKIIEAQKLSAEPKIAFLSSEFHLLRSGVIAKKAGVSAESVAAPSPQKELLKNYARELLVFPAALLG